MSNSVSFSSAPLVDSGDGLGRWRIILFLASLLFFAANANAQDKSRYSLSNPTPDRLLRDMTTDRPDLTEVPFTVDAGRVQTESTFLGFARSRPDLDGALTQGYELMTTNIRIGLTHNTEANIVVQPFAKQKTTGPDGTVNASGIGALVLRAKWNLWGNDTFLNTGSTALALLPYISLPTDRYNGISPEHVDGGLFTFFAVKLGRGFSLGINAGLHMVKNVKTNGRHPEASGSASLGYEWTEKLTTYVEAAARGGTQDPLGDIGLMCGGIAYKITPNLQLDGGMNFGVTRASDRFMPFLGLSARF